MSDIPEGLLDGLDAAQREKTIAWWATLTPGARMEFRQLWDERTDDTAYSGVTRDGEIEWHELPIELVGEFVDEQDAIDRAENTRDLLEYICGHEGEKVFFLVERRFHLCRAHARAREVVRTGWLPYDFDCPLADRDCPMRRVLAAAGPGRSIRIRVGLATHRSATGAE